MVTCSGETTRCAADLLFDVARCLAELLIVYRHRSLAHRASRRRWPQYNNLAATSSRCEPPTAAHDNPLPMLRKRHPRPVATRRLLGSEVRTRYTLFRLIRRYIRESISRVPHAMASRVRHCTHANTINVWRRSRGSKVGIRNRRIASAPIAKRFFCSPARFISSGGLASKRGSVGRRMNKFNPLAPAGAGNDDMSRTDHPCRFVSFIHRTFQRLQR
jgi:hypothetical protein